MKTLKRFLLGVVLVLGTVVGAWAQNPTCPTRPAGDSSNACASTAFVGTALTSSIPLASASILVGNASNIATARVMSQDCTISNTGVITCLKTNNVSFGALATVTPGSGVATWTTTPSSANLASAVTDETGSGSLVFANTPTLVTPILGVASATSINGLGITSSAGSTYTQTAGTTITAPSATSTLLASTLAGQVITGGATVTAQDLTEGNITVNCGNRPLQYINNDGAFTITAPAADGSCMVLVTNGASAGTISFSGFSVGSNTGDTYATTNTNKYTLFVWRINGTSGYRWAAHQ